MKKSRLSRDAPTQSVDPDSVGISRFIRTYNRFYFASFSKAIFSASQRKLRLFSSTDRHRRDSLQKQKWTRFSSNDARSNRKRKIYSSKYAVFWSFDNWSGQKMVEIIWFQEKHSRRGFKLFFSNFKLSRWITTKFENLKKLWKSNNRVLTTQNLEWSTKISITQQD